MPQTYKGGRALTVADYLKGRIKFLELTPAIQRNTLILLNNVNALLTKFGELRTVNSGFRTPEYNTPTHGIPNPKAGSAHLSGEAIDLEDHDGQLKAFCTEDILKEFGLYLEHPSATPTWCHLQTRPPKSGKRIFYP